MKVYVVYRCLYGEDFVQESINSIEKYADKIFVFWTNKCWGNVSDCIYKNKKVIFQPKYDSVVEKIKELKNPKIIMIEQTKEMNPSSVPWNLYTTIINNYILPNYERPDIIIIPEVDHVFRNDQAEIALTEFINRNLSCAKTRQIELWRTPLYRIAERLTRVGVVFWNLNNVNKLPRTGGNGEVKNIMEINCYVHNFGFAISEKVMFWKHMTAIGFSSTIGDSLPNEDWLDKWLMWSFANNNSDLEISKGYEHTIPMAFPYNPKELPELIKERYDL